VSSVLGPDLSIYAIGGYGGPDQACLRSAERFDITTNSWMEIPNMSVQRRALAAVTLPDGIYAIGGYDGQKYLDSVEKFDIRMNK